MEQQKSVFVTGITGNQGYSVAQHLLSKGFMVKGLTRNSNSGRAQQLNNKGVQLIEGNLDTPSTYISHLEDVDAIFLVQALQGKQDEIKQGKQFLDSLKSDTNVHLVYASVLGADLSTGVPHFESKFELENYITEKSLAHTILRPASFYENHLMPQVVKGIKKGKYISPLKSSCIQQMIGVDDIGKIVAKVIAEPNIYMGRTLSIATDEYQIGKIPGAFSEKLKIPIKYGKLPGIIVRLAMGKDLYKMFKYMNKNNFRIVDNIESIKHEFEIQGDFKSWISQHFCQD